MEIRFFSHALQLSLNQNPRGSQPKFKSHLESPFSRAVFQKKSKEISFALVSWTLPEAAMALRDLQSNPPWTYTHIYPHGQYFRTATLVYLYVCGGFIYAP